MNDAMTQQAPTADGGQVAPGHGKHRGPVSTQDGGAAPRGRHRRPVEEQERTESAA
ncbi:hypothetical protein [Streptomyces sp. enrichment culture]|uniref:hypothetical protein n=1 Tax=Streptomyces sp. enrichment culture TaxID=1795815 RepID=UPI003F567A4D